MQSKVNQSMRLKVVGDGWINQIFIRAQGTEYFAGNFSPNQEDNWTQLGNSLSFSLEEIKHYIPAIKLLSKILFVKNNISQ